MFEHTHGLLLAGCAALGVHLLLQHLVFRGAHGESPPPGPARFSTGSLLAKLTDWMSRTGIEGVSPTQYLFASAGVGVFGAAATAAIVGIGLPALLVGLIAACTPSAFWRARHRAARSAARECWPRLIEELRVLVGSAGRPIPQALIEVGLRGPEELRPAFTAAQREWALSTDFELMISVLKTRLDDPCADATCETLLTAYEVGGTIDSRLAELAEDRRVDLRDRKEADARQAGARLARWFVVIVPLGMAFAGWNMGEGAGAFRSGTGQLAAGAAVLLIAVCWWWAGRIMVIPPEQRVFVS